MTSIDTGEDGDELMADGIEGSDAIDLDTVLRLLSKERRRRVLYFFVIEGSDTARFEDLVDWIRGGGPDGGASDGSVEGERIRVELHHTDLPMLEDAGVVEYDVESGSVRYRGSPRIEAWIETAGTVELADESALLS